MKLLRQTSKGFVRRSNAILKAISQLFNAKYTSANNTSEGRIWFSEAALSESGAMPETAKNNWEENHADSAGAATLNSALSSSGRRLAIQKEITNPSRATVNVPAAGP